MQIEQRILTCFSWGTDCADEIDDWEFYNHKFNAGLAFTKERFADKIYTDLRLRHDALCIFDCHTRKVIEIDDWEFYNHKFNAGLAFTKERLIELFSI